MAVGTMDLQSKIGLFRPQRAPARLEMAMQAMIVKKGIVHVALPMQPTAKPSKGSMCLVCALFWKAAQRVRRGKRCLNSTMTGSIPGVRNLLLIFVAYFHEHGPGCGRFLDTR